MKFKVFATKGEPKYSADEVVEINTLEELVALAAKYDHTSLIIDFIEPMTIEIYNDYRE